MFVRTKHNKKRGIYSVMIVHNYRSGDKVRQKVLRYVGCCSTTDKLEGLYSLADYIVEKMRQDESDQVAIFTPKEYQSMMTQIRTARKNKKPTKLGVDLGECYEEKRVMVGIREVFSHLYFDFGWTNLFGARKKSSNRIIQELVIARIWQPRSKRATVEQLQAEAGIALNLDRVYRAMDELDAVCINRIRDDCFNKARVLFKRPVDILFYDLTTLYFESERDDDLRRMGYSKDGKPNRVQVVLALIINEVGLPVGYEVFTGNTFEGHTLRPVIERLRAQYQISRMTMVADSALLSSANRQVLSELGIDYIMGYRFKNARKQIKEKILDATRYQQIPTSNPNNERRYQVIEDGTDRIVVCYSSKRARKDAMLREKAIKRLKKRLSKSGTTHSVLRGDAARYLTVEEGNAHIDEDKVEQQARWDGLWALTANGNNELSATELVNQYRNLWKIEHGFRTNKHDLRVRPIFHWTPSRIQAHLAICFMAFCLVEHLRYRLKLAEHPMSVQQIRNHLSRLQFSVLGHEGSNDYFALPSQISPPAKNIYRVMGLTWYRYPFKLGNSKRI